MYLFTKVNTRSFVLVFQRDLYLMTTAIFDGNCMAWPLETITWFHYLEIKNLLKDLIEYVSANLL